jgi:hypothetical protein
VSGEAIQRLLTVRLPADAVDRAVTSSG